jgi:hypothetical protein
MKQDWLCKYKRNIEARSPNICCTGKAIRRKYCECVSLTLNIRHAMRMGRTMFSSVTCLAVYYFSTSHKMHNFRRKVFWFSSALNLKQSHSQWIPLDYFTNVHKFSYKLTYRFLLSDFNEYWLSSTDFRQKYSLW